GWIWERTCVTGPLLPAGSPDSLGRPDSAGTARPRPAASPWMSGDSLRPAGGLGSVSRLRVLRNGPALLARQDFRIPDADSVVHFAAPVSLGDTVCLERASTPLLAAPVFGLYRMDQVPVYRSGISDTAASPGPFSLSTSADTAYSKYQLNYSGSKSMAVTVG